MSEDEYNLKVGLLLVACVLRQVQNGSAKRHGECNNKILGISVISVENSSILKLA